MKLYLVKGSHPTVPGQPQTATFDRAAAEAIAADLVATLAREFQIVVTPIEKEG